MFETANKVLNTPLQVEAGRAIVPTGIGLGISVNEDFIRAHSSETWLVTNI
jgi:L-alanine-DL-glutamate epimerase-like enolase superfamily enzyme